MYNGVMPEIQREELVNAIVALSGTVRHDAIVMTKEGKVKAGTAAGEDTACVLMTASELGRKLCAEGLFAYTGKELKKWATEMDIAPLQAKADAQDHCIPNDKHI